jgi:hypothetical protein
MTQSRYVAPVSGGAIGLGFAPERLNRVAQGSLPAMRNGIGLGEAQDRLAALGHVVLPGQSIEDAIRAVTGTITGSEGARIFVSEGDYDIGAAGLSIAFTRLEIIALAPGKTVLRRTVTPTAPIFTLSGSRLRLQGLRLKDSLNTGYDTVRVTGDYCEVVECHFDGASSAVELASADYCVVRDCLFENVTTVTVDITGTSSGYVVANNRTV